MARWGVLFVGAGACSSRYNHPQTTFPGMNVGRILEADNLCSKKIQSWNAHQSSDLFYQECKSLLAKDHCLNVS